MADADTDTSWEAWKAAGMPNYSYAEWVQATRNKDSKRGPEGPGRDPTPKISGAPGSGFYNHDRTDEQFGMDADKMSAADRSFETEARVAGKRGDIANRVARGLDVAQVLPPDIADLAFRDATSGRVRRARTGSARSAIMGPDITTPGYKAPKPRTSALSGYGPDTYYGERKP